VGAALQFILVRRYCGKGYDSSSYDEIVIRVNGPYGANYYGSSGSAGETGGVQSTNWSYIVLSSDGTNCSLYKTAPWSPKARIRQARLNFPTIG